MNVPLTEIDRSPDEVQIGGPGAKDKKSRIRLALYAAAAVIVVIAAFWWWLGRGNNEVQLITAPVERGLIKSRVTATGSLSALVTVEVGAQLSGQVKELYADFNSEVTAGQVIARIDPAPYETRVAQAEAELAIAKASVAQADADILKAEAALTEAQNNLKRSQKLHAQGNLAESSLDTAIANAKQSEAQLASSHAQHDTAEAQVKQREASLESAKVDLEHTYIRSPVDGVVIGRTVSVGQTVAASFQTPVLFTIAQDLSKMQVEVSVDEADIGQIKKGQEVVFTVDAYPDHKFDGRVEQIRKAPVEQQNVVTYTVIVSADNSQQKLLPGMTANVEIITAQRDNALKVPTSALSFHPPADELKKLNKVMAANGRSASGAGRTNGAEGAQEGTARGILWVSRNNGMTPVPVTLGLSGGSETEILSGNIHEGDRVIVAGSGQNGANSANSSGRPRGGFRMRF